MIKPVEAYDEFFLTPNQGGGTAGSSGEALLRSLPPIRRARGFRLYTAGGRRLTDLWQYGGRAVLGHTPAGVLRELKNAASRGLFAPFPGCYEGRFVKALTRLFPGRTVRLYAGAESLRRALDRAGYDAGVSFPDPAFPLFRAGPAPVLWRPFLEDPPKRSPAAGPEVPVHQPPSPPRPGGSLDDGATIHKHDRLLEQSGAAPILVPVLPSPWAGLPYVLILDTALEAAFPASGQDLVSPVVLTTAARSVWDLIAALPERSFRKFPRIRKALGHSPWRRRGVYLTLTGSPGEEAYAALFRRFLENGFLLPPSPGYPLILPGELSPGEEAALAGCLSP
ncbi:MAG: hypothetical protein LBH70_02425 [Spirochaetaceae bacterium]|jgi:hypothetical protein|nr:hypothetical protein [Spirochaetaceae bacterium]